MQLSRPSSGAMAASPEANQRWSSSSYPPGLLVLSQPSQEFRSPDDNDGDDGCDAEDDSADAIRGRSSARGWLGRRGEAGSSSAEDRSAGQRSPSEEAEVASVARTTGCDAAAAAAAAEVAASRRASQRGAFPSSRGSSPARPNARSRPHASTPMPAMGSAPSSARRPRRDVARPVSYEEPSLNVKMRK